MNALSTDVERQINAGNTLAKSVSAAAIPVRARQLDQILNCAVVPALTLHGIIIGALIIAPNVKEPNNLTIGYSIVLVILGAVSFFFVFQKKLDASGYLGTFTAFATATALTLKFNWFVAIAIVLPYALLAYLVFVNKDRAKEFRFAPVYTSLFLFILQPPFAWLIYSAIFLVGIGSLAIQRRLTSSFGLFAGMAIALFFEIHNDDFVFVGVILISLLCLLFLAAYLSYEIDSRNSNLKNFLNQGLAAFLLLAIFLLTTTDPHPYWIWPASVTLFAGIVYLLHASPGVATSIAWITITTISALWLTDARLNTVVGDASPRTFASISMSFALYVFGRKIQNHFICNVARLLLLACAACCLYFWANDLTREFVRLDIDEKQQIASLVHFLAWNKFDLVGVSLLSLCTVLALAYAANSETWPAISWWRGLIKPRHALLVRNGYRASVGWLENAPIVGAIMKLLQNGPKSLRYLKGSGDPVSFAEVSVILSLIFFGLTASKIFDVSLNWLLSTDWQNMAASVDAKPQWQWLSKTLAWALSAVLAYAIGLIRRQTLYLFVGLGLALVPLIGHVGAPGAREFGIILLVSSLTLFVCCALRQQRTFPVDPK